MKVVIDTNIVIDALSNRMPFATLSQNVLLAVSENKVEGFLTSNTVTDIYYLLHKHLHDSVQTKTVMSTLFESLKILSVEEDDCKKALDSVVSDFEDAVLVEVASRKSLDCIVTRNIADFKNSTVQALSPDDFLKKLGL